jgi:hypothetical protein
MKISIKGFVKAERAISLWHGDANVIDGVRYVFHGFKPYDSGLGSFDGVMTFEKPDDFDPRAKFIEELKEQERALNAEFAKRVTDIRRQISELTALEFTA